MSAVVGTVAGDSSSEDEDLQKFKEAAWSFDTCGNNGTHSTYTEDAENKPSRRLAVSKHEHDGNELQTTPEFRTHVANKLGAILDSCISVISAETSKPAPCTAKCEDEGFKLFTTSVPGDFTIEPPPAPLRRRPILVSSDSDTDRNLRSEKSADT
ncbi:hypothetical protein UPYG_G00186010 [Umbra pygmaea]|uniref:Protein CUSTOS n=1 Tax=Umbra pygmaea TaxID=75934 RepID=A0ABD0XAE5_UMBPY